jgi:hypothetical protein
LKQSLYDILRSFKDEPQWNRFIQQQDPTLTQQACDQIDLMGEAAVRVGKELSKASDIQWDSYKKSEEYTHLSWQQRQERMDALADQFSQTVRGVESFEDPIRTQTVELPGGLGQAWANELSEYIVSDDPSYNPNIGSTINWTQMARATR